MYFFDQGNERAKRRQRRKKPTDPGREQIASQIESSLWSLVGGLSKHFKWSREYILWGISYSNLCMHMHAIPSYDFDGEDDDKPEKDKKEDGDINGLQNLGDFLGL